MAHSGRIGENPLEQSGLAVMLISEKDSNNPIDSQGKQSTLLSPVDPDNISSPLEHGVAALKPIVPGLSSSSMFHPSIEGGSTHTIVENDRISPSNGVNDPMVSMLSSEKITCMTEQDKHYKDTFTSSPSNIPSSSGNQVESSPVLLSNIVDDSKRSISDHVSSKKSYSWPLSSKDCLPPLADGTIKRIIHETASSFPINEECTALAIPPSGRHIVAGFTDGTVRLFDTTGRLWSGGRKVDDGDDEEDSDPSRKRKKTDRHGLKEEHIFDCDSSTDSKDELKPLRAKHNQLVLSKSHQTFGAVACQIYARGVITSLLMDVAVSEDGLYAFAGVLRGSTELVAVDLSGIERFHDEFEAKKKTMDSNRVYDLLDLVQVYTHSDAKLKGFGACTRLQNGRRKLEYRLFTGKGIKNMHIWAFIPPQDDVKDPIWQCLYDTPTNGNSINYLHFRYDANGILQGLTKSDDQRLRIWDLSYEQHKGKRKEKFRLCVIKQLAMQSMDSSSERPKRPPCVDVACTENALAVFGAYVFSGGSAMYNQISVTSLDVEDVSCQFNHSEFALPFIDVHETMDEDVAGKRAYRSGRQQRGDLKSVAAISGLEMDGRHVVLEMSDGCLMHYCQNDNQESSVRLLPSSRNDSLPALNALDESASVMGKAICVTRVGREGIAILASACFDPVQGRGSIRLRELTDGLRNNVIDGRVDSVEFWGFHGVSDMIPATELILAPMDTSPKGQSMKRKNKDLGKNETSRLFVTPEPKTKAPNPKVRKVKTATEPKVEIVSPAMKHNFPVINEEQTLSTDLVLPTTDSLNSELSKPVNVVSDSPEKQPDKANHKQKNLTEHIEISSFFQRNKPSRKGDRKDRSDVKTGSRSTVNDSRNSTLSEGENSKDYLIGSSELKSPPNSTEALVSYEFSATYSSMTQKKPVPLSCHSAADLFYSMYRDRRYRLPTDTQCNSLLMREKRDENPLWKTQEIERNNLSNQHYAAHVRFFESFMTCSQQLGHGISRLQTKEWFDEFIQERKAVLRDMLERQEMEATTLAALQMFENGGIPVEKVAVSFPFHEIFEK